MAKISKTADSQPIDQATLFSCSGFLKTCRKFGIDANRSAKILKPRASRGLFVSIQSKIPTTAARTEILFLKSNLLSPNLIERMATANCETQSDAGSNNTCQGASPAHELITTTNANVAQVHQDAEEGLVSPLSIDLRYGMKPIKEIIGAAIPKIS